MNTKNDNNEMEFISSGTDPVGKVFQYKSKIYRLISSEYKNSILEFLHSELYSVLLRKEFILPATVATNLPFNKDSLILEHPKIPCPVQPYEWTFHMLQDACITLLKIFLICQDYGYTLKDGHPWNISFYYTHPFFLDFGSFRKKTEPDPESFQQEFISSFYFPLKMWSKGEFYFAHRMLSDDYYPRFDFYNTPFHKYNRYLWKEYCVYAARSHINALTEKTMKKKMFHDKYSLHSLLKKIQNMKMNSSSLWKHYHDGILNDQSTVSRFTRLLELLKKYEIHSMIDLAGNQGAFSLFALQHSNIRSSICADYDEGALDVLYCSVRDENRNLPITPLLMNVLFPIPAGNPVEQPKKADVAVALALTHHLILTQKHTIDLIFSRIKCYTRDYVLIEFMPLGLWDGLHPAPPVPAWYTEDWFQTNFQNHFELLEKQEICVNRIAFLGRIKQKKQNIKKDENANDAF